MCRELIVKLIEKKKVLYQEQYDNNIEKTSIEEELFFKSEEEQAAIKGRLQENEARETAIAEKIIRAHRFGQHHTKISVPSICLECYVERDESSEMTEIESTLSNNIRQFKCKKCLTGLYVEPAIG